MLKWNEPDLIDFFGVLYTFCDDSHSYSFEVSRDGLRLLVTLFDLEGAVYVSIFRDGLVEPIFTVHRELCTHTQIIKDVRFRQCFEAGATKYPVTDMGIAPALNRGIRVYVNPQFQVELIEPPFDIS